MTDRNTPRPAVLRVEQLLSRMVPGLSSAEDRAFDDLGLDSLDRVELLCAIDEAFEVRLQEEDLRSVRTVSELIELIARHSERKDEPS